MIKEIYGDYCFWSWLRFWYLDSVSKQSVILMDKTKVVYHKDEKCLKSCRAKRKANAPLNKVEQKIKDENIALGKLLAAELEKDKGEAQPMSDAEVLDEIAKQRTK